MDRFLLLTITLLISSMYARGADMEQDDGRKDFAADEEGAWQPQSESFPELIGAKKNPLYTSNITD